MEQGYPFCTLSISDSCILQPLVVNISYILHRLSVTDSCIMKGYSLLLASESVTRTQIRKEKELCVEKVMRVPKFLLWLICTSIWRNRPWWDLVQVIPLSYDLKWHRTIVNWTRSNKLMFNSEQEQCNAFHQRKCASRCCLQNLGHFNLLRPSEAYSFQ